MPKPDTKADRIRQDRAKVAERREAALREVAACDAQLVTIDGILALFETTRRPRATKPPAAQGG